MSAIVVDVVMVAIGGVLGWLVARAWYTAPEDVPRPEYEPEASAAEDPMSGDRASTGPGYLDARPVDLERMFYDDAVSNDELRALDVPRPGPDPDPDGGLTGAVASAAKVAGPGHTPTWPAQVAEYEAELARYLANWDATVAWWAESDPGWLTAYREAAP